MGANEKYEATFHPFEAVVGDLPAYEEPVILEAEEVAEMLVEQFQCFMEEGGNDLRIQYVDEVTQGGRIVTVDWSNGQRFQVEVTEVGIT